LRFSSADSVATYLTGHIDIVSTLPLCVYPLTDLQVKKAQFAQIAF